MIDHPVFHHPSHLGQVLDFISELTLLLLKVLLAMIVIARLIMPINIGALGMAKMSLKDVKDEQKSQTVILIQRASEANGAWVWCKTSSGTRFLRRTL